MYRVTKSIDVDFAHHIDGHPGHCINIHGHTWKFELTIGADHLGADGFVCDFAKLKANVLKPIHDLLDHSLAISEDLRRAMHEDRNCLARVGRAMIETRGQSVIAETVPIADPPPLNGATLYLVGGIRVVAFQFPPTSERLAEWTWNVAAEAMQDGRVSIEEARVYETLHPVAAFASYDPWTTCPPMPDA